MCSLAYHSWCSVQESKLAAGRFTGVAEATAAAQSQAKPILDAWDKGNLTFWSRPVGLQTSTCSMADKYLQERWQETCDRSEACWQPILVQQTPCPEQAVAPAEAAERQEQRHHRPAQRADYPQGRLLPALPAAEQVLSSLLCHQTDDQQTRQY